MVILVPSRQLWPIKITLSEKNGALNVLTGYPSFSAESVGKTNLNQNKLDLL
jgi:hypothetical protein